MNILFTGGGSIGHIAPAVAVWEALHTLQSDATAHFVCSTKPDDAAFLTERNLSFTAFDAPRLSLRFPVTFLRALRTATTILDTQKPDIIFSKGGYVSLPLCYVAHRKGIPIVTHESDSVSGYANKIIARWAMHTCTGFPELSTFQHFNISTFTGNPIRADMTKGSTEEALRITGLDGKKPILLVSGGSQGSLAINNAVTTILEDLLLRCNIIHITGRNKSQVSSLKSQVSRYYQTEFANDDLQHFYAAADIAISRAGAGSIAEHAANGIPTILIPLRGVGHDHQYRNAIIAAKTGGCLHLEQKDLDASLLSTVHNLIANTEKRTAMSEKIRTLYKPDAALQIAKIIVATLDSASGDQ